jgi:hypothetical protein
MRRTSIFEKNLKAKKEVSEAAFHFLFSEIVQYCLKKDKNSLSEQLEEFGYSLGPRYLELLCFRERGCKKETKIVDILWFIAKPFWLNVFNKPAPSLEVHANHSHIYMLKEESNICNRYACLPKGSKGVNCAAFVAGILEGFLNAAGFSCRVSAVYENEDSRGEVLEKTTFIIYFAPEIVRREREIMDS